MKTLLTALLFCSLPAVASTGEVTTGNDFLRECHLLDKETRQLINQQQLMDFTYCNGYVTGFIHGVSAAQWQVFNSDLRCVPHTVTSQQIGKIGLKIEVYAGASGHIRPRRWLVNSQSTGRILSL